MIVDNIKNLQRYQEMKEFYQMLKIMRDYTGQQELIAEQKLPINEVSFTARNKKEKGFYENHKKYIDIHYILAGEEKIDISDVSSLDEVEPYATDKDIMFLTGEAQVELILRKGDFLICYPQEAHKVGGMVGDETREILKLVGKIKNI